jgi:hypothetical protein
MLLLTTQMSPMGQASPNGADRCSRWEKNYL